MTLPSPHAPAPDPPPPAGYRVIRALGGGGMGSVWLCTRRLGLAGVTQRVVLKRPRADAEGATAQRFVDEARSLARVEHRNVVRLLDAGADATGPWLAVEHVDGVDGAALLEAARGAHEVDPAAGLTAAEIAWLLHEAAAGVAAAHAAVDERGAPAPVLHRDVSPQNLLLSRSGEVKVADFGIARAADAAAHTTTGVVVGNLRYIAPEQLEGRAVTARTDVYGLGRVLEELLAVAAKGARDPALDALAARCTRRAAEERPEGAAAVRDALRDGVPSWPTGEALLAARVRRTADTREQMRAAVAGLLGLAGETGEAAVRAGETASLRPTTASLRPGPEPDADADLGESVQGAPPRRPLVAASVAALAGAALLVALVATWRGRERPDERAAPTLEEPPPVPSAPVRMEVPPGRDATVAAGDVGPTAPPREPTRPAARRVAVDARPLVAPTTPEASATLLVSSLPYATVSVDDGAPFGTPHAFTLPAGEHAVTARFLRDGAPVGQAHRRVTLAPGQSLRLGLQPE